MGYESKLYVVEKHRSFDDIDGNKTYSQVIAMLDLCKYYPISSVRKNYPATDCYFYADDDTKVLEDKYGDPLREIPIEDVIEILEKDLERGSDYRRIYPTLAALKALNEHKHQWKELTVLHYGY
jgi:hypothetical protein